MIHMHDDHTGGAVINQEAEAACPVMSLPASKQEAELSGLARTFDNKVYCLCCIGSFEAHSEEYVKQQSGQTI